MFIFDRSNELICLFQPFHKMIGLYYTSRLIISECLSAYHYNHQEHAQQRNQAVRFGSIRHSPKKLS